MHIYFDNASTTPMYDEVIDAMYDVFRNDFGNPSSIHSFGRKSRSLIEKSRKSVASIINASVGEIFFTSCATEANNWILESCVKSLGVQHIIISAIEHHCVLNKAKQLAKEYKIGLHILDADSRGRIDVDELDGALAALGSNVLVSIMFGNNEIGSIQPIGDIGEICKKHHAYYHCDTVQGIGKYPIDVQQLHVHFLSASAHKFHGPKGIGFAYIRNDAIIPPLLYGGSQERNMRAGTENTAGIVGLAKALEIAHSTMDANRAHYYQLKQAMIQQLSGANKDIKFNGFTDHHSLAHILSISLPPSPKSDLMVMNLDIFGIAVSSGSACTAGIEEDSHVMQAIQHPSERKAIRCSFSAFNTLQEVDIVCQKIIELLG